MLKLPKPDWINHETLTLDGKSVAVSDSTAVSGLLCSWLESRSKEITYAGWAEALPKAYFNRKTIVWNQSSRVVRTQILAQGGNGKKLPVADMMMAIANGGQSGQRLVTIIKTENQIIKSHGVFQRIWLDLVLHMGKRLLRIEIQNPMKSNGPVRVVWEEDKACANVLNFEIKGREDPRRLDYVGSEKVGWQLFLNGRADKPFSGVSDFVSAIVGKELTGWESSNNQSLQELSPDTNQAAFLLLALLSGIHEPEEKMTTG